ncbi:MAG TPA: hypothetical protein VGP82_13090 [Ktedonobacterales bacterium]|nr:hypothetical protein [Ktedonobacterales bacterium]
MQARPEHLGLPEDPKMSGISHDGEASGGYASDGSTDVSLTGELPIGCCL